MQLHFVLINSNRVHSYFVNNSINAATHNLFSGPTLADTIGKHIVIEIVVGKVDKE